MAISAFEQETIINFNKEEDSAVVFTYEKSWQKHIEKRFGVLPFQSNEFGGKSYLIPKSCIRKPMPHFKRTMTPEHLAKLHQGRQAKRDYDIP